MTDKKKALILSAMPQKRLSEEFEKKDWEVEVVSPSDLYCYISDKKGYDRVYLRADEQGKRLKIKEYSAIVPRISGAGFDYGCLALEQLTKNLGIFSTASPSGLKLCSNKFETSQFLSQHRIRNPKQILAHKLTDFKETIELIGGLPCIVKLQKGSQGSGVYILRNEEDTSQTLRALRSTDADLILQQKIDSGTPANDLRIWVIGAFLKEPKVIGYKRFALDGDFRSNYSLSKSGEKVKLTDEEKEMAINSARALNMHVAGVDIMLNTKEDNRPYVIEVNGNPGLAGIEAVTGENVAAEVVNFVVNNYSKTFTDSRLMARESVNALSQQLSSMPSDAQTLDVLRILNNASRELRLYNYKS